MTMFSETRKENGEITSIYLGRQSGTYTVEGGSYGKENYPAGNPGGQPR